MVGSTTVASKHGDGLADDLGIPPAARATWGWTFVNWLRDHSAELGIQQIIYDRKIWSCNHGTEWKTYVVPAGGSAHTEHAHVELTDDSGRNLTVARINAVAGGAMPTLYLFVPSTGGVAIGDGITYRAIPNGDVLKALQAALPGPTINVGDPSNLKLYGVDINALVNIGGDVDVPQLAELIGTRLIQSGLEFIDVGDVENAVRNVLRNGIGG
jgi:hypothetical protein